MLLILGIFLCLLKFLENSPTSIDQILNFYSRFSFLHGSAPILFDILSETLLALRLLLVKDYKSLQVSVVSYVANVLKRTLVFFFYYYYYSIFPLSDIRQMKQMPSIYIHILYEISYVAV